MQIHILLINALHYTDTDTKMEDEGELALCNYYRFYSRSSLFFVVYLTTVSSLDNVAYNNVDIKNNEL